MVWGAFCATSTLQLEFPTTRMNSAEYIGVLEASLIPFINENSTKNFIFQQDNASVHKSRETAAWMTNNNINVLEWPACSPDINPIENLWSYLVRVVYAENKQYSTIDELKIAIIKAWSQISNKLRLNLVSSLENRIFELIQKNGDYTHY